MRVASNIKPSLFLKPMLERIQFVSEKGRGRGDLQKLLAFGHFNPLTREAVGNEKPCFGYSGANNEKPRGKTNNRASIKAICGRSSYGTEFTNPDREICKSSDLASDAQKAHG